MKKPLNYIIQLSRAKYGKAVILARVSTLKQEQEGLSLEEIQLPRLREYAHLKNYSI